MHWPGMWCYFITEATGSTPPTHPSGHWPLTSTQALYVIITEQPSQTNSVDDWVKIKRQESLEWGRRTVLLIRGKRSEKSGKRKKKTLTSSASSLIKVFTNNGPRWQQSWHLHCDSVSRSLLIYVQCLVEMQFFLDLFDELEILLFVISLTGWNGFIIAVKKQGIDYACWVEFFKSESLIFLCLLLKRHFCKVKAECKNVKILYSVSARKKVCRNETFVVFKKYIWFRLHKIHDPVQKFNNALQDLKTLRRIKTISHWKSKFCLIGVENEKKKVQYKWLNSLLLGLVFPHSSLLRVEHRSWQTNAVKTARLE